MSRNQRRRITHSKQKKNISTKTSKQQQFKWFEDKMKNLSFEPVKVFFIKRREIIKYYLESFLKTQKLM